jgi:TPR repeat protein
MNIADLQKKAQNGSVVAQTILGTCYLEGVNVEINYVEALRLLSAAAERRAPRAMSNLARMYAEGLGTTSNLREAIRLYEAAAEAGEFEAQIQLARIYSRGTSGKSDPQEALRWYSAAISQAGEIGECPELQEAEGYVRAQSK